MANTFEIPTLTLPIGIDGAREEDNIKITDRAVNEVRRIKSEKEISDNYALRLGVTGQSCSGMRFGLGFDNQIDETDKVFEIAEFNVVIDNKSLFYMQGITLDYINDLTGNGFIFNNPYHQSCGGCDGH